MQAGEMLRTVRERQEISQTCLARRVGKSSKRISALETGAVALKVDELVTICTDGLQISPMDFFAHFFSENKK